MSSGSRKAVAVVVLAVVAAGAVAYTVIASRSAMLEARGDKEIIGQRIAQKKIGLFTPGFALSKQASAACPEHLDQVNRAVQQARDGRLEEALEALEDAWAKEPACVGALRELVIVTRLAGGTDSVALLAKKLKPQADAQASDAVLQLAVAYCARELGRADEYRKYLERATSADSSLALLQGAWSAYWDSFAKPRNFAKELAALQEEVKRTADPGAMIGLARAYWDMRDADRAMELCDSYFAVAPEDTELSHAGLCLQEVLYRHDAAQEPQALKRYWAAQDDGVSEACKHADLSIFLLSSGCRAEEGLKEAETAIAQGCVIPGACQRRANLFALGRYDEAAVRPIGGIYFEGGDPRNKDWSEEAYNDHLTHAKALAMVGRNAEALKVLEAYQRHSDNAVVVHALIEDGLLAEHVKGVQQCRLPEDKSARLAIAASGYIHYGAVDEARGLLEQALKENPKSSRAWGLKIYLLSIDGKLDEAVREGEQALSMGLDRAMVLGNLGYVYEQLHQCDKAIPLFEKQMSLDPWGPAVYTNLARCYEEVGRDADAARLWRYVQGGRPRTTWWMYVALVVGAVVLYFGTKLTLITLLPSRFGHLKFP